jgi:DNA mismatch repair protein MutL
MSIKVLTSQIVSKIAAGEVVERPASVVKELIENSLDADASQVSVEVQGGGVTFIRVTDNGSGISGDDVELAFTSHATSKITSITDLEAITTLGFRGEALPSIASMADVDILTQVDNTPVGNYLRLANGSITSNEKHSRPRGTTITVRHLFRHFPARLKFLKSPTTENSHIANLLTQYALAYPEVKFSLSVEGRSTIRTSGNGKILDVVAEVYGIEVAQQMLEIEGRDNIHNVTGLASQPSLTRSSRNFLSFFVNRRWVRSSLLIRAAENAYQGFLMTGRHPIVIINLSLPPRETDINVHPTKTEIKFRNNQTVFSAVESPIRKAIADAPPPRVKPSPISPASAPNLWTAQKDTDATIPQEQQAEAALTPKNGYSDSLHILRVIGQLALSYIMSEGPDGLYLIDQHAAHERILFEKILGQRSQHKVEMQGMLEPINIELSPRQEEILKAKAEELSDFGLNLEHFGGRSYLLRAMPAVMAGGNAVEAVRTMLDSLGSDDQMMKLDERIAYAIACHGAIKAGDSLSIEEMREMVRQLEQADQPRTCPHGRPTMIHLSSHQLEKEFGRRG